MQDMKNINYSYIVYTVFQVTMLPYNVIKFVYDSKTFIDDYIINYFVL